MKKVLSLLLVAALLFILSSCTAGAAAPDDSWASVFLQFWNTMNMEYVRFSAQTDLDWDEVYEKYLPLFRGLDYSDESDSVTAFRYFKEIAINIDDCHFDLIVRDNYNNFLWMAPARERKWADKSGEDISSFPDVTSDGSIISVDGKTKIPADDEEADARLAEFYGGVEGYYEVKNLTDKGSFHNTGTTFKASMGYSFKTYENDDKTEEQKAWNEIVNAFDTDGFSYYYAVTEDNIFYFYFSSFLSYVETPLSEPLLYKETLSAEEKEKLGEKYVRFHDYLWDTEHGYDFSDKIRYFKGIYDMFEILKDIGKNGKCCMTDAGGEEQTYTIKGVVMDLRSNSGGDNSTLETIFGSFFRDETKIGETRYKDGYSRYEYGPWIDLSIEQSFCNGVKDYEEPFVVITNGNSISCAELSASIAKNLMKNGAVVGATTYGATCSKVKRSLYHSGSFSSKNLSIVMASLETKLRTKDGSFESFENKGIEPSSGLSVPVDDTYVTDTRFEAALNLVRQISQD